MLECIFGKRKSKPKRNPKARKETNGVMKLDTLKEAIKMLERNEVTLQNKVAEEVKKAKEFSQEMNKSAAMKCLKRKKLYEQQIEQLGNFQLRIHDQMIMLEGAQATMETVTALRTGADAMKKLQMDMNIGDVDKTMDEINEQTDNLKQVQEVISAPFGADYDEDELEAELEDLVSIELEEELLKPVASASKAPAHIPKGRQSTRPSLKKNIGEEADLAAKLKKEMAL